jgi:hypothetical protein
MHDHRADKKLFNNLWFSLAPKKLHAFNYGEEKSWLKRINCCVFCKSDVEFTDHLFFTCNVSLHLEKKLFVVGSGVTTVTLHNGRRVSKAHRRKENSHSVQLNAIEHKLMHMNKGTPLLYSYMLIYFPYTKKLICC